MSGRRAKWGIGIAVAVVVAAIGGTAAGAYLRIPRALAGENRPTAAPAPTSQPDLSTPVPTSPTDSPSETPPDPPSGSPSAPAGSPAASGSGAPAASGPGTGTCAKTGTGQLAVERYLAATKRYGAVTVDGRQDAADCVAIRKFQVRFGIRPASGYAGALTARVATRLAAAALDRCDAGNGTTICVDLTSQTMWVVRDGAVVLGPTTVRTGRAHLATPAGHYRITERGRHHISSEFHVQLPYWQRFNGGMGFHQTPSYLYDSDSPGSHGCVNLLKQDAIALWGLTSTGTPAHIFGQKPGT